MIKQGSDQQTTRKIWFWVGALVILGWVFYTVRDILTPFIIAFVASYLLNPAVVALNRWGIPRVLGTGLLILCFFALIGFGIFYTLPFLKAELLSLAQGLPSYVDRLYAMVVPILDNLDPYLDLGDIQNLKGSASRYMTDAFAFGLKAIAGVFTSSLALANLLSLLILTPIITFYLLQDWPRLTNTLYDLLPKEGAATIVAQSLLINGTLRGYLRGQALVCLSLGVLYSVGLWLVGLPFAFTIGLATGFLAFIPYGGFLIGACVGIGVAFAHFTAWSDIGWVAAVFALGQGVESYVLSPKLVGDRTGLHPVWMIFALLSGGMLFGFMGVLLAIPTAAILGVLVRFGVAQYRNSLFYRGQTAMEDH